VKRLLKLQECGSGKFPSYFAQLYQENVIFYQKTQKIKMLLSDTSIEQEQIQQVPTNFELEKQQEIRVETAQIVCGGQQSWMF
jgi:hypothetical protein